jgi:hypothetical protein
MSFLTTKDDVLVNNTLEMLLNLMKSKRISSFVLTYCGLNPQEKSADFYTRTNF